MIQIPFIQALDALIVAFPDQLTCESWGRSTTHNATIKPKGAPGSQHLFWNAVDIIADNVAMLPAVAQKALDLGFTGVEWAMENEHIHLDMRPTITNQPWRVVRTMEGQELPLGEYLRNHFHVTS